MKKYFFIILCCITAYLPEARGGEKVSALDVSQYILQSLDMPIDTFRLHKLLYFSQKESLLLTGEPLFEEDFLAWKNGPVVEEVFREHEGFFGVFYREDESIRPNYVRFSVGNVGKLEQKHKEVTDRVLERYRGVPSHDLVELSHEELAWKESWGQALKEERVRGYRSDVKLPIGAIVTEEDFTRLVASLPKHCYSSEPSKLEEAMINWERYCQFLVQAIKLGNRKAQLLFDKALDDKRYILENYDCLLFGYEGEINPEEYRNFHDEQVKLAEKIAAG